MQMFKYSKQLGDKIGWRITKVVYVVIFALYSITGLYKDIDPVLSFVVRAVAGVILYPLLRAAVSYIYFGKHKNNSAGKRHRNDIT